MPAELFSIGCGRRAKGLYWRQSRDGDDGVREVFDRHYSRYFYKDGRMPKLFTGPGQKEVLVTEDGLAIFIWRKFISADGQEGVNCAVFRNEGPVLSSLLVLDAEAVAWARWPNERLFTYVNPRSIRSSNPGACFKHAGWSSCGVTKTRQLVILQKYAC